MTYDFNRVIDRRNTTCIKWDTLSKKSTISFGVADMDFSCPPQIQKALHERIDKEIYGYTFFKDDTMINCIHNFSIKHFGYAFDDNSVHFINGVVPCLGHLVNILTDPGDNVIIQTPVYGPFFQRPQDVGRNIITNPLAYENGSYSIDFIDFEDKIKNNNIKLFILCNPHNPVGLVFSADDLRHMGEICQKYNVMIISDEIHRDLNRTGVLHFSMEMIMPEYKENIITCIAPSKTFNLAGMVFSLVIINGQTKKEQWENYVSKVIGLEESSVNVLSKAAAISAYSDCDDWLAELKLYLDDNFKFIKSFLSDNLPKIKFSIPNATYLAWFDLSEYTNISGGLGRFFLDNADIVVSDGTNFGKEYMNFIRFNAACPRSVIKEGLERLKFALENV